MEITILARLFPIMTEKWGTFGKGHAADAKIPRKDKNLANP